MKKALLYLLLFTITLTASSKTLDDIFNEFSKVPRAENIHFRKFIWSLIKTSTLGNTNNNFIKKISSMRILDLESCSSETKTEFSKQIESLDMEGYELLLKVKNNDDNVLILSKNKKNKINEFIIVSVNDPAIVKLKGNFTLKDLADVDLTYGTKKKDNK